MGSGRGGAPQFSAFGDAALLVSFGKLMDAAVNRRVHGLAAAVEAIAQGAPGLAAPVPAYASLLVPFDPLATSPDEVAALIDGLLRDLPPAAPETWPRLDITVRYGGADGPDLDEVAERTGLTPAQVVELHASVDYRCFMLGFSPGFAFLGELPAELELPRRDTPRQRVPQGSVAIGGRQTAVYPLPTPGGWHLLGRTELPLWDLRRDPPTLIRPGQMVRFVPA
jgi:KipI family sensor histidine kinase inhibitor